MFGLLLLLFQLLFFLQLIWNFNISSGKSEEKWNPKNNDKELGPSIQFDARKEIAIKYEFLMNNLTMSGTQQLYWRRAHIMSQMGLLEYEMWNVNMLLIANEPIVLRHNIHIVSISNAHNKALDFMLLFFCNLPASRTIRE